MAGGSSQTNQIVALRRRIERSRFDLERAVIDVRNRYDVPARVRGSMRRHPREWFFGSMGAGVLAAMSLRRRRKRRREHGGEAAPVRRGAVLAGTLGFLASVAKPVARQWLTRQFLDRR